MNHVRSTSPVPQANPDPAMALEIKMQQMQATMSRLKHLIAQLEANYESMETGYRHLKQAVINLQRALQRSSENE